MTRTNKGLAGYNGKSVFTQLLISLEPIVGPCSEFYAQNFRITPHEEEKRNRNCVYNYIELSNVQS